ncbi:MAG: TetR/AcrR family transcriptional regulator, partial [Eggerthellaceae bacterium]|nr:TetR/AcrR family transcriptional regulator [Eggerthellaceae bacterium]
GRPKMARKDPARTAATRKRIEDAFWSLYRDADSKSITASAVARAAGVNRSTFYAHFRDVGEVLESIESDLMAYMGKRAAEVAGTADPAEAARMARGIFDERGDQLRRIPRKTPEREGSGERAGDARRARRTRDARDRGRARRSDTLQGRVRRHRTHRGLHQVARGRPAGAHRRCSERPEGVRLGCSRGGSTPCGPAASGKRSAAEAKLSEVSATNPGGRVCFRPKSRSP